MELKTGIKHRLNGFIGIDEGMAVFLMRASLPISTRLDPKIDLASIYELSVILVPITFVVHGFSFLRFGRQIA